jgi:hypothetical protein
MSDRVDVRGVPSLGSPPDRTNVLTGRRDDIGTSPLTASHPRTVRAHVANIFAKLGVHSRAAAVARAYDLDLA